MPLFLTSLRFDGLNAWLDAHRVSGPVAVITNASAGLDDRAAIVAAATDALTAGGTTPVAVDVCANATDALSAADVLRAAGAIVMTGGDPFRLLADLRRSGADRVLIDAHGRGVPVAGQSAGAIVCGPTLAPIRLTSPFAAPPGLDLGGLGLCACLVLPHHGTPGRSARHRAAALESSTAPDAARLTPLWDDETLVVADDVRAIQRGACRTRPARRDDAAAVGRVFHDATVQAWSTFLGRERLLDRPRDEARWAQRIEAGGERFLVTEDAAGVLGFVCWKPADDGSVGDSAAGTIDLLYTHPRAWGGGNGRRLLDRATWALLREGCRDAVLWTEARNARALAVYRANGWRPDGAVDERDYLGVEIRNVRLRLDLITGAGGA